ncbi:D-alanine--D-alanine ligase [Galenea microaerophila]
MAVDSALSKVGVLMGGVSEERAISLNSGQQVLQALQQAGVNAEGFDVQSLMDVVQAAEQVDVVFIALHGRWGEDGQVQAILQSLNKPFTGSGVAASALAMDKLRTKLVWQGAGLPTPKFIWISPTQPFSWHHFHQAQLDFPVMVKPCHEGSSIGMKKVENEADLEAAIQQAQQFDAEVLVEQWITGREFTVGILGHEPLPLIELETQRAFYDYQAKYEADDTRYHCPVHLPAGKEQQIQKLARQAFETLGAQGWGRIDVMLDQELNPYLIELNTVPGMTDHSLVPMAAKHAGLGFSALVLRILQLANGS